MKLGKIFENDSFIIWQDNKGWDFAYDIENKTDEKITIQFTEFDEAIEVEDWVGLFNDEEYIINDILEGKYFIRGE
jgi:hypothetical protein